MDTNHLIVLIKVKKQIKTITLNLHQQVVVGTLVELVAKIKLVLGVTLELMLVQEHGIMLNQQKLVKVHGMPQVQTSQMHHLIPGLKKARLKLHHQMNGMLHR